MKGRARFEAAADLVETLASRVHPSGFLVEINLVGERRMTELNRLYRGRRGASEILTFPYSGQPGGEEAGEDALGEIFICWKRLESGAKRRRVSSRDYLLRLIAHGLCHLKGFRHHDEEAERTMEEVEQKLLRGFVSNEALVRLFE